MPRPPKLDLASIVAAAAPPAVRLASEVAAPASALPGSPPLRGTLKQRARQLSVYLEPPVYDQLRDIAYAERLKMHGLMLEALDLLFKARGALSIEQMTRRPS